MVKEGDAIPDVTLHNSATNLPVKLKDLILGRKIVLLTFPGAFTPVCNGVHLPGYVQRLHQFEEKNVEVFAVTTNDVYVNRHWVEALHAEKITMLSDPDGELGKALDLLFENPEVFGHEKRYKRAALIIDNGIVKYVNIDSADKFNRLETTAADFVLKQL